MSILCVCESIKKNWEGSTQNRKKIIFPSGKFEEYEMGRSSQTKKRAHNAEGKFFLFTS